MNFSERVFLLLEINHTDAIPTVVVAVIQREAIKNEKSLKRTEQTAELIEGINEHCPTHFP